MILSTDFPVWLSWGHLCFCLWTITLCSIMNSLVFEDELWFIPGISREVGRRVLHSFSLTRGKVSNSGTTRGPHTDDLVADDLVLLQSCQVSRRLTGWSNALHCDYTESLASAGRALLPIISSMCFLLCFFMVYTVTPCLRLWVERKARLGSGMERHRSV